MLSEEGEGCPEEPCLAVQQLFTTCMLFSPAGLAGHVSAVPTAPRSASWPYWQAVPPDCQQLTPLIFSPVTCSFMELDTVQASARGALFVLRAGQSVWPTHLAGGPHLGLILSLYDSEV